MTDSILCQEEMDDIKRVVKDDEIQFGDVVGVRRMDGLYDHYGIYTGNGGMIHYADPSGDWGNNIVVHRTTIDAFRGGAESLFVIDFDKFVKKHGFSIFDIITPKGIDGAKLLTAMLRSSNYYHLYTPKETVQRAESRLGEKKYNIATNNCEHFAIWCKTGVSESTQVEEFLRKIREI